MASGNTPRCFCWDGVGRPSSAWMRTRSASISSLSCTLTRGLAKMLSVQREGDVWRAVPMDADLRETMQKLVLLHDAGACPTELVGLSDSGHYLIAKQPLCRAGADFPCERRAAAERMKAEVPAYSPGREIRVFWLDDQPWSLGDLHERNIMFEVDGTPMIIDALIGPIPPLLLRAQQKLLQSVDRARLRRQGQEPPPREGGWDACADDEL